LKPPRHVRIVDVRATNVSVAWLPPDEASIISNVLGYKVCRVDGMLTLYGHVKTAVQRPLYSNTVIGTLAVDGWAIT